MREEVQRRMGEKFDLRAFHDAVLAHGAVPLSSLERLLREHAQSVARESAVPRRGGAQRQRQRRRRARSGELPRLSGPGTRAKVRA